MAKTMRWVASGVMGIAMLAAGCGSRERETTEAAINAAQAAVNAVQVDAERYVPEQVQAAQSALQSARTALAKNDYDGALAAARDAANKAKEMAVAAVEKKKEWERSWAELNESIPKSLEQVKYRLYAFSHGARLPEGMDKDGLEEAEEDYTQLKENWAEATGAATQGNLREAIEKGTEVREALAELRDTLGFKT